MKKNPDVITDIPAAEDRRENPRNQHEAYIQGLLELQRRVHRSAEETETTKLLVVCSPK
jgi:hypothetical protein